jgi:hypothetical protein
MHEIAWGKQPGVCNFNEFFCITCRGVEVVSFKYQIQIMAFPVKQNAAELMREIGFIELLIITLFIDDIKIGNFPIKVNSDGQLSFLNIAHFCKISICA